MKRQFGVFLFAALPALILGSEIKYYNGTDCGCGSDDLMGSVEVRTDFQYTQRFPKSACGIEVKGMKDFGITAHGYDGWTATASAFGKDENHNKCIRHKGGIHYVKIWLPSRVPRTTSPVAHASGSHSTTSPVGHASGSHSTTYLN
ncbi:hypothetical protein V8E54_012726 [Elaphomyces granulatus]